MLTNDLYHVSLARQSAIFYEHQLCAALWINVSPNMNRTTTIWYLLYNAFLFDVTSFSRLQIYKGLQIWRKDKICPSVMFVEHHHSWSIFNSSIGVIRAYLNYDIRCWRSNLGPFAGRNGFQQVSKSSSDSQALGLLPPRRKNCCVRAVSVKKRFLNIVFTKSWSSLPVVHRGPLHLFPRIFEPISR